MIIAFPVGAYTGGRLGDGPKDYGSSPARPRAYRIFEPAAAKIDHPTMQGILSRWDSSPDWHSPLIAVVSRPYARLPCNRDYEAISPHISNCVNTKLTMNA